MGDESSKMLLTGLSTSCSNGQCRVSCGGEELCSGSCSSISSSCSSGSCRLTCNGGGSLSTTGGGAASGSGSSGGGLGAGGGGSGAGGGASGPGDCSQIMCKRGKKNFECRYLQLNICQDCLPPAETESAVCHAAVHYSVRVCSAGL